jgi:hypothetical protein
MDKYLLTLSNPRELTSPHIEGAGVIFRGILTVDRTILDGTRLVTSLKCNDKEVLITPSSSNENNLISDTLRPSGGDPSGINFRMPTAMRNYFSRVFSDTNTTANLWDDYSPNGIMIQTASRQYYVTYDIKLYQPVGDFSFFIFVIILVFIVIIVRACVVTTSHVVLKNET